ncbi:MAG: plastocyanin/azurin family copper-binding protein, partial [Planctomycetota bacterium]|nr:plastocyanin/azurin family copper-binding protein [Planctomycetota bacterium]
RSVPLERWPSDATAILGATCLAHVENSPADEFETASGRELLALADELAPRLDRELATRLRRARRRLGPQVIVIRPVPDSLLFDRKSFTVVAGRPVELVFDNVDIMPHNLLLAVVGALAKVGMAGERMAAAPDAWARGYVPDLPEVLQATRLLQPGESQTLRFDAPDDPGDYPYVCTFPGHWVRMNGVMRVVTELEDLDDMGDELVPAETEPAASVRPFVRSWSMDDLKPHLDAVDEGSAERGRSVFEAASCLRCHAVGGEGGTTGPELGEVVARYGREELLLQILEPSLVIAEEYVSEIFFTVDGLVFSGRVVSEDGEVVRVQDDPYQERDPQELLLAEIEERIVSDISTMPAGLLSTFEREEILDLLAYLESLAPTAGND